jgi:hypothetical protein
MWVGKQQAGSGAHHVWAHDGDVIEVDDELGAQLLAIPGGGFFEGEAPAGHAPAGEAPDVDPAAAVAAQPEMTEITEAPAAKPAAKRAPRGRATTAAAGPQDAPPNTDVAEA